MCNQFKELVTVVLVPHIANESLPDQSRKRKSEEPLPLKIRYHFLVNLEVTISQTIQELITNILLLGKARLNSA